MAELEILGAKLLRLPRGYGGEFLSQLTRIRVAGVVAFVRENRRASGDESFVLSSNARLGHKADGDRIGREVLELAAPAPRWSAIAEVVAAADELGRPVVRHQRWTPRTAREAWEGSRG